MMNTYAPLSLMEETIVKLLAMKLFKKCPGESKRKTEPQRTTEMISGKSALCPSAFFDFDDTIIEGDSILYWMSFYYRRRPLRRVFQIFGLTALLLYVFRIIDGAVLKRIFLMPMCYEDEERLDALAREFVQEELVNYMYPNLLERMWTHKLLSHRVVVISASPFFYLKHLRQLLPTELIIGTHMRFPKKGLIRLPEYVGGNVKGRSKILALAPYCTEAFAGAGCFGYSDHHSDRFLLEYSEFPCCVLPTVKLRKIAAPLGWPHMPFPNHCRSNSRRRAEKLVLLILGWSPGHPRKAPSAGVLDLIEGRLSPDSLKTHYKELKKQVLRKYPGADKSEVVDLLLPPLNQSTRE